MLALLFCLRERGASKHRVSAPEGVSAQRMRFSKRRRREAVNHATARIPSWAALSCMLARRAIWCETAMASSTSAGSSPAAACTTNAPTGTRKSGIHLVAEILEKFLNARVMRLVLFLPKLLSQLHLAFKLVALALGDVQARVIRGRGAR